MLAALGIHERPRNVDIELVEVGAWGKAWDLIQVPAVAAGASLLLSHWETFSRFDAEAEGLWRDLEAADVPEDPDAWLATWLVLQAGNAMGRPVQEFGPADLRRIAGEPRKPGPDFLRTTWKTAGLARLAPSARERGFRAVVRPRAIAEKLDRHRQFVRSAHIDVKRVDVRSWDVERARGAVVLFDPPYAGDGYSIASVDRLTRAEIVRLSFEVAEIADSFGVCYDGPIDELVHAGWTAHHLKGVGDRRPKGMQQDWITVAPRRAR